MTNNLIKHFKKNMDMISNNPNFKNITSLEEGLKSRQPKYYDQHISIKLFGFESTE